VKELSFYEQVGIVIPGSLLLFGILFFMPEARPLFLKDGLTIGGFGLFLLIGYGAGHLTAAVGNLIETVAWLPAGMPSQWPASGRGNLLGPELQRRVIEKLSKRHSITVPSGNINRADWSGYWHIIYRDTNSVGPDTRIDAFNGAYGLNRGLAAASMLIALICALQQKTAWFVWSGTLVIIALLYLIRMRRFGVHFAREVFLRFVLLPDARPGA
jgi:hypothetical protein